MTSKREGFHTLTPYVVLRDAAAAIEFYKQAFQATVLEQQMDEQGLVRHAEIKIGNSPVMITSECQEWPELRSVQALGGLGVQMFLYVQNADAVVGQAVAAGATSKGPVEDKPYGRSGGVVDPYGLTWWICS